MFATGSQVTVKVRNVQYARRHVYDRNKFIPEYNVYSGTVVRERWYAPNQIGLTTGEKQFKVRVIEIENIMGTETEDTVVQLSTSRIWTVEGSKGNAYTVSLDNGHYDCTCPGFGFRKQCKHVNQIMAEAV